MLIQQNVCAETGVTSSMLLLIAEDPSTRSPDR